MAEVHQRLKQSHLHLYITEHVRGPQYKQGVSILEINYQLKNTAKIIKVVSDKNKSNYHLLSDG